MFHGNDSKKPCGSRVDRHEHIGEGCLGLEPFRRLLHDPRFADLPMLIETEKMKRSDRPGAIVEDPFDARNLGRCARCARNRRLAGRARPVSLVPAPTAGPPETAARPGPGQSPLPASPPMVVVAVNLAGPPAKRMSPTATWALPLR